MREVFLIFLFFNASIICAQNAFAGRDTVIMSDLNTASYMLDASESTSDNDIINYYWVYNGDTIGNSEFLEVQLTEKKNRFKLIIEDNLLNTDFDVVDIYLGHSTNNGMNRLPLRGGTIPRFVSGMNLAWKDYANDLNEFTNEDLQYFQEFFDSISVNGGNAVRWWLHTNGANTPIINSTGFVEGIEFETIQSMKKVLDMAFDNGIAISMCLWSFDMLQNQLQDREAMKLLLTNSDNIQSYIDNALIPTLAAIGDHPAVMTWEIFNEPEGMSSKYGWTPYRIQMEDIQMFVNMCAGAIHRNTSQALVSNGSWSIQASSDVGGFTNYYSKDRLIEAGGDMDGYLDFYQIHYYPYHSGVLKSPFHIPASYWELDAPVVIGEFPADTLVVNSNTWLSVERAYEVAVYYGYAGVMSWSWSDTNFNKDFETTARGLRKVESILGSELTIPADIDIERTPQLLKNVVPFRSLVENISGDQVYLDLKNYFYDEESGNLLDFNILELVGSSGITSQIENESIVKLSFTDPSPGISRIKFRASDNSGWFVNGSSVLMLGTLVGNESNLAYFKPIEAGSEGFERYAIYANDGSLNTSWESQSFKEDTIVLDLKAIQAQNFIALHWNHLSVTSYEFQISNDSLNWETIFTDEYSNQNIITYTSSDGFSSRYLRLITGKNESNRHLRISEIISENIINNQPPVVKSTIDDLILSNNNLTNKINYVRFRDIFDDFEHAEYLTYDFEYTNPEILQVNRSIGNIGLNLLFDNYLPGESIVTITATDPFGASVSSSFKVTVEQPLSSSVGKLSTLTLYPNPVKDLLFIEPNSPDLTIQKIIIYDRAGRMVEKVSVNGSPEPIDLSHYPAGYYIIHIKLQDFTTTKRFIKQ